MDARQVDPDVATFLDAALLSGHTTRILHALLQGPDSWRLRLQLQKLAGVQRVLDTASVASCFLPVAAPITKLIASDRSEVVKQACRHMSTALNKAQVFRQAGKDCLSKITSVSKYDIKILVYLYARRLIVQQVTTVVTVWPKPELAEHCDDLLLLLTGAIEDPKGFVRLLARQSLCAFAEAWSERMEQFAEILPLPQRPLIIVEHPSGATSAMTSVAFSADHPPRGKRGYSVVDEDSLCNAAQAPWWSLATCVPKAVFGCCEVDALLGLWTDAVDLHLGDVVQR
ncbi:hypothetical protein H257_00556 [Aphanomyces astaci]|uniref:CLASP N-terminal domain-containing protein n=1 Tax=Aphanomyces astaci TaxID=112090 RepID=W4HD24_APHAT|nr:hypothetical protein H257_00556 [Aphanomyces astaci]ETV89194.1 hypothetical protein H257_00556 [Aphanomyces astaci]|eukprot:XP_009821594.1 hypothetical protein H257_00556 [Aphanomyces astaci]